MAQTPTPQEMEKRIARFKRLTAHPMTFLDQAFPENERDVFNIIGRGVSEEEGASAEITDVDGFNMQMSRAKPGKGNGLHSHTTVETFIPLNGRWKISWGDRGENEVVLEQFDVISVPPGVMRSFRNIGDEEAYLLAILGGTDAGRVTWSPELVRRAKERGWELDSKGDLLVRR
ncbi:MAG TPA: cupin domain-containing protein [Burkholderiales bacterium]|nr:cupin domain-containing protein [Burkholderiales bacterium]